MKPPTSLRKLQMTLDRIVWMRHFIETNVGKRARPINFSTLIFQMNLLNRKENKKNFVWSKEPDNAFEQV